MKKTFGWVLLAVMLVTCGLVHGETLDDAAYEAARKGRTIASYTKYIENFPGGKHVYRAMSWRGVLYYMKKKYDLAIADLTRVIKEESPGWSSSTFNLLRSFDYNWRARSYKRLGKYKKAAADFRESLKLKPAASVYRELAGVYDKLGKTKKANEARAMAAKLPEKKKK